MSGEISLVGIADEYKIKYIITPQTLITDISSVKVYEGDREISVKGISTLYTEEDSGYIEVGERIDLTKSYRVAINGYGEKTAIPTEIFDSRYFAQNYHYGGDDLGAYIKGGVTVFKLWAPTASRVVLNLFTAGDGVDAYKRVDAVRCDKGVWTHTEACGHGTYYTYTVTTATGTCEAVDPYVRAVGVNGNRGMVVDLSLTDPEGGDKSAFIPSISSYSDAVIWEVHVRDFSNKIESSRYKGKYLAFTETGLVNEYGYPVGLDYLKALGVTHVHLLPVYDYATVDETDLRPQFNWGYDPKNYNAPEGSYSTDPYHGEVRIKELKHLVMALHNAGIGVIADVVYNHTYGPDGYLNRIVPYYYYRYTDRGVPSSASGCGNDTASERYMFGKFMVESVSYWIKEYDLDGFRFDLMGLHDLKTMQAVERAVHSVDPRAIIYGEGWRMGSTLDGSEKADQLHISKIIPTVDAIGGIAVFNDVMRDGLKGNVFDKTSQGYINGSANEWNVSDVQFGILGGAVGGKGWSVKNSTVINYMSAHDNHTLWDKLLLSSPHSAEWERSRMNNLGAAIIMISKGTPFFQAGEEMLRTKKCDGNSYKSSDSVNNIDWSALNGESIEHDTMLYYRGLISMRKAFSVFRDKDTEITFQPLENYAFAIVFNGKGGEKALAVINPDKRALAVYLDEWWNLVADGESAGPSVLSRQRGDVIVDGISVRVYVNDVLTERNKK